MIHIFNFKNFYYIYDSGSGSLHECDKDTALYLKMKYEGGAIVDLPSEKIAEILYGSRYSLRIGLIAVMISALGGIFLGSLAGYFGGKADLIIMRLLDVLQAMPGIVLAIAISARTDQFRNRSFHQFYSRFCEDDQSVHIECAADGISGSGDVH